MSSETAAVGLRIAEAREQAGLTQQELAAEAGIERTALAKIERGLRGVGALELASLARALEMRIEWFVVDAPVAIVSHRTGGGEMVELATIDKELERLARDIEMLASLDAALLPPVQVPFGMPDSGAAAERLAEEARQLCHLDQSAPVNDLVSTLGDAGLFAFSRDLGTETADAGTILLEHGGVALVNSSNLVGRRRLALAHEFGHFLVADEYTIDWRIAEHNTPDETESRIDRFARAFLAPAAGLTSHWRRVRTERSVRDAAVLTASYFRIDMSTLARRLHELGVAAADECSEVRRARTTQTDIVEDGLVIPHDLEATSLPRRYSQSVLRQYRRQMISPERALSLLGGTFGPDDLPELPPTHVDELWNLVR
jgi:Zn-dependent peptidase ImmA (M78 family)/DNA-binding XRE family transcriptional regulator